MSRTTVLRLAAESARDPMTVQKVLQGQGSPLSRDAVFAAAKRLSIELPPEILDAPPTRFRAT